MSNQALALVFMFEHPETVHSSLSAPTEMQNIENTWAQNSSSDVPSAMKKGSFSHCHSCNTMHSLSMISKHPAQETCCGPTLLECPRGEGLAKTMMWQTNGCCNHIFGRIHLHLLCCYSEFTEDSQKHYVTHITASSWPLQTRSSSQRAWSHAWLSFLKHLFLHSVVLPSCFVRTAVFHKTCLCSITTSNTCLLGTTFTHHWFAIASTFCKKCKATWNTFLIKTYVIQPTLTARYCKNLFGKTN